MIKLLVGNFVLLLIAIFAVAQDVNPVPEAAGGEQKKEPPPAFLRAWLFPAENKSPVAVSLRRSPEEPPRILASSESGARVYGPDYADLPAGAATLEVLSGTKLSSSAPITLRSGSYYTAVARNKDGKWQVELFTDPPLSSAAPDRPLRILNLAAGRTAVINHGPGKEVKVLGDTLQEIKLPSKLNPLSVSVLAPGAGAPALTSSEVDFQEMSTAFLLIAADRRGRMRPEIIPGGPAKEVPLPPAAAPTPQLAPDAIAKMERERMSQTRRLERDHLAAQMAMLEAQIKEGINVPTSAEQIRQELRKQLKALDAAAADPSVPSTASP